MSYFDDASLVMIPSGYKTSKVYSVKPTDGSGDLTFSRSNDTATRVNSAGLIEKVRTNLFLQSQTFENAYWSLGNTTIAANATTAPDGTLTAEKLTATTTGVDRRIQRAESISAGIYTNSIFVKASELNLVRMYAVDFSSQATFTLTGSGTISGVIGSATPKIESVGNGWYRCSMSVSFAGGSAQTLYLNIGNALGGATINAGDGVFIWGAQLETGDIATDYIATTTAAVSVGPVANVPRLDYLGSTCGKLILEPQRTNLVTYSEQFANWSNAGGTTTANTAISPSGYQDADTLTGARFQSGGASNQYTASCFAKKVDGDGKFVLRVDVPTLNFAQFNLNNGTIDSTSAGYTSTITPYGNGWYRCTLTTPASTTISNFVLVSANGAAASTYVWGAQLEAGAYATSYIPTLGAAVTRGADACSKTGISSLIGQTEGTLFAEFDIPSSNEVIADVYMNISDGTSNNEVYMAYFGNGRVQAVAFVGGSLQVNINLPSYGLTAGRHKFAFAYKNNDYNFFIDGVSVGTDTSASVPATSAFNLVTRASGGPIMNYKQALLFKTRLTNAQLAELTTL